MQYLLLIYVDEGKVAPATLEEIQSHVEAFSGFVKEAVDRGALRAGEPLQPTATATTVRVRAGETLVTDGPFAETKEQLAGFYVVDCGDLDEAIELAARIPASATGSIEVRRVWEEMSAAIGRRM